MNILLSKFEDLNWTYPSESDARIAFDEAFVGREYSFRNSSDSPFIVDCGAHIGASVLFFKSAFPHSSILAFEPNSNLFGYLVENVNLSGLRDVDLREIALSDVDADELLFGGFDGGQSTVGNSTSRAWGDRPQSTSRVVAARKLSPFLNTGAFRTRTLTGTTTYGPDGRLRPIYTAEPGGFTIDNTQSRWRIQLGAKVSF